MRLRLGRDRVPRSAQHELKPLLRIVEHDPRRIELLGVVAAAHPLEQLGVFLVLRRQIGGLMSFNVILNRRTGWRWAMSRDAPPPEFLKHAQLRLRVYGVEETIWAFDSLSTGEQLPGWSPMRRGRLPIGRVVMKRVAIEESSPIGTLLITTRAPGARDARCNPLSTCCLCSWP